MGNATLPHGRCGKPPALFGNIQIWSQKPSKTVSIGFPDIVISLWFFNDSENLTLGMIILQWFLMVFQIIVSIIAINRVIIV